MLSLTISNRFDSKSSRFFRICRESYKNYEKWYTKLVHESGKRRGLGASHWFDCMGIVEIMEEHRSSAVVFGVMCLEAFIYDYAATNFSGKYTQKYLDSLDFIAKWVVIPKLVTGKDFPRESQAFEHLGKLANERNKLVHPKSKRQPRNDEEWEKLIETYQKDEMPKKRLNPYETVVEVLTELRKLDEQMKQPKFLWELKELDEQKQ